MNKFKSNKIAYKFLIIYFKILYKQNNKVKYIIQIQICLKINQIIYNKVIAKLI